MWKMEPETVVRRSPFLCAQSQRTVLFSAEFSNGKGTFLFQNDVRNILFFFFPLFSLRRRSRRRRRFQIYFIRAGWGGFDIFSGCAAVFALKR